MRPRPGHVEPGSFVDRYELLRSVARGGMGIVWEARLRRTHGFEKRFALKTLLPHLAEEGSFRAMFLDEMRIASQIVHPNVCEVHDFGEAEGTLFLALEWIDGLTLQSWLAALRKTRQRTPTLVALRIAADIAMGLHAAHELRGPDGSSLQVVHRDVTPHNIIVRADGVSKLVDFGIAKARNRISDETTAGTAKGKLRFMAPEQLRTGEADRRTDVRALGAVLYALLTGRLPYAELADADTLMSILRGEPIGPPIEGERPELRELLDCALAADKTQRFETAEAFARAIEGLYPEIRQAAVQQEVAALAARLRLPEESGSKPVLPLRSDSTETDALAPGPMSEPPTVRPQTPSSRSPSLSARAQLNRTIPMQQTPPPVGAPFVPATPGSPLAPTAPGSNVNRTLALSGPPPQAPFASLPGPAGHGSAGRIPSPSQPGFPVSGDGRPTTVPPHSRVRPIAAPFAAPLAASAQHPTFRSPRASQATDPRITFGVSSPPARSRWPIALLVAVVVCVVAAAAWFAFQFIRHRG